MNGEYRGYASTEGTFVILKMGPVGGAHFAEPGAAFRHDIRYAERATDLDQLAARDQHFTAFGDRVE
jgi:hypothetical protein